MKSNTNRRKEGGFNSSPSGRTQAEANSSSFYETDDTKKAFSDRMNYLLINSIGCIAVVTVPTGVKYSGLLYACNPSQNSGIDVIMKYPRIIDRGIDEVDVSSLSAKLGETLLIEGSDVAELELKDLDFTLDEKWENNKRKQAEEHKLKEKVEEGRKNGFKTDVDISGAAAEVKERQLKKWVSDDAEPLELMGGLEDNGGDWDQFAVNEEKFGITSTFDEHLYTTKINKDDPNYEARLKEADRIAKEIESQGTSGNVHLAEERGLLVENSDMDEEDKYSGVDRRGDELLAQLKMNAKPAAEKPQKYVPPSLRNEPHHADPAIISSSKKSRSPPVGKTPSDKKSQLDELKKFSEKFNVPYKMPDEIKTILKKNEEDASPSSLKVNPSLPPKPTSQVGTPSNVATTSIPLSKPSRRNSKPSTPAPTKAELKRGTMKYSSQGGVHTPISSPSAGRANTYRRRSNSSFFGDEVQKGVRKDFNRNFNMFLRSKNVYDLKVKEARASGAKSTESFVIERPYFTTPTWNGTMEKSFKTMFPDERTAIQKIQLRLQQRTMNAMSGNMPMGGVPGMMAMPVGPGGSQSTPFMASPGMFMPFQPQPMFYPPVPQMLTMIGGIGDDRGNNGHSPSPGANSPHGAPSFMNGAGPMGPFAYPASFQPIMGPIGSANASGSAVPSGSGSSYKGHYHNHNHNHNHNNGNRYHRHR